MRTVKWNPFLAGLAVVLGTAVLMVGTARADVSTTHGAAIIVFPKLVADESAGIDTIVQVVNISSQPTNVRCFYVNANGHCSADPSVVCDPYIAPGDDGNSCDLGAGDFCIPGWVETDFRMRLTPNQPVSWVISEGLPQFPLASPGSAPGGHFNEDSSVPPVSEDPFFGELKCVVVGDDELPTLEARNWLAGHATIETPINGVVDLAGYNAFGIQAIDGANNRDNTLVLGQEYNGCPNIVALDHYFDGAEDPATGEEVVTEVTFAPCSQDFNFQFPKSFVVQFLTFNEFEQRLSASRTVFCLTNIVMSDLDSRLGEFGDQSSIFNIAVQGTLTGQTLMRGVNDDSPQAPGGETFVLLAQRIDENGFSGAYHGTQRGTRPQNDFIQLPAAAPAGP